MDPIVVDVSTPAGDQIATLTVAPASRIHDLLVRLRELREDTTIAHLTRKCAVDTPLSQVATLKSLEIEDGDELTAVFVASRSHGSIEEFPHDVGIVLDAVKRDGLALERADAALRDDEVIARAAIGNHCHAMEFIGPNAMLALALTGYTIMIRAGPM